jgi:hypothetical protein
VAYAQATNADRTFAPNKVVDVVDKAQVDEIIKSFQNELNRLGFTGRITSCDHVINVYFPIGGHDSSYAALCNISIGNKNLSYWMCNDRMVGKFTLGGSDAPSREGGGRFVVNNCPAGG